MRELILVGAGGFLGAAARYWVGTLLHRLWPAGDLPVGTLGVNLAGCFLLGLLNGLIDVRGGVPEEMRLFLAIGLLGGFTTFSTFGFESLSLLREPNPAGFLFYTGLHLLAGLAAVWAGFALGRWT